MFASEAQMFALVLLAVVLLSAAVLLHQYRSGALASDDAGGAPRTEPERVDEVAAPARAA